MLAKVLLIVSLPCFASAKKKKADLYTTVISDNYTDLKSSSSDSTVQFSSGLTVEIGIMMRGPYSLIISSSKANDGSYKSTGLGGRANFPGFFMFGGSRRDLRSTIKKKPVSTSAFVLFNSHTDINGSLTSTSVSTKFGITMDIFLFNPLVFLQTNFTVFNYQGNAFTNLGVGLGVEF